MSRALVFVEVEARNSDDAADLALDEWRLRRVSVAAKRLAPRYMRDGDESTPCSSSRAAGRAASRTCGKGDSRFPPH